MLNEKHIAYLRSKGPVEYSRWYLTRAQAVSTYWGGDLELYPSRYSWAFETLLNCTQSVDGEYMIQMYSDCKYQAGKVYCLAIMHERNMDAYRRTVNTIHEDINNGNSGNEVLYISGDSKSYSIAWFINDIEKGGFVSAIMRPNGISLPPIEKTFDYNWDALGHLYIEEHKRKSPADAYAEMLEREE